MLFVHLPLNEKAFVWDFFIYQAGFSFPSCVSAIYSSSFSFGLSFILPDRDSGKALTSFEKWKVSLLGPFV